MRLPRVLITGADGLVGQSLVRRLSALPDVDLLATSRAPGVGPVDASGGRVALDVTDGRAVEAAFLDFAPSVVVHLAALSRVEDCERDKETCWAVNVDATAALARQCKHHGARLVLLSTDFLFDGAAGPYAEDARPNPLNTYGRTKLAAENAIRGSGLSRWTILRTSLVFGHEPGVQRDNVATTLVRELGAGRPWLCPVDQRRSPTYAPDLADGIARVVRSEKTGVFHLAGREIVTIYRFAERLAKAFGFDPALVHPTTTAVLHPGAPRPLDGGLLILRAEAELGFRPRLLDDALAHLGATLGLPVVAGPSD